MVNYNMLSNIFDAARFVRMSLAMILVLGVHLVQVSVASAQPYETILDCGGSSDDVVTDVYPLYNDLVVQDGSVICGFSDSTDAVTNNHLISGVVAMLRPDGSTRWRRRIVQKTNMSNSPLAQLCFQSVTLVVDPSNPDARGIAVVGWQRESASSIVGSLVVCRFSYDGDLQWIKYFKTRSGSGKDALCCGCDVILRANGNICIAGVANEYSSGFEDRSLCGNGSMLSKHFSRVWYLEITCPVDESGIVVFASRVYAPRLTDNTELAYEFRTQSLGLPPLGTGIFQGEKIVSIAGYSSNNDPGFHGWSSSDGVVIRVNVVNRNDNVTGFALLRLDASGNAVWWKMYETFSAVNGLFIDNYGATIRQGYDCGSSNKCIWVVGTLCDFNNYRGLDISGNGAYKKLPGTNVNDQLTYGKNVMLAKISMSDGTVSDGQPLWCRDYGDPFGLWKYVPGNEDLDEEGWSIAFNGESGDCSAYIFGSKYAHSAGEPGLGNYAPPPLTPRVVPNHQGWIIKTRVTDQIPASVDWAQSIGGDEDDHFSAGVVNTSQDVVFGAGHSSSYCAAAIQTNDMFVVNPLSTGLVGPCASLVVNPVVASVQIRALEITYYSCEEYYTSSPCSDWFKVKEGKSNDILTIIGPLYPCLEVRCVGSWECINTPLGSSPCITP